MHFFFFSLHRRLCRAPQRLSHPRYRNPATAAGAYAHLRQLLPRPNLFAASLEGWPAGSPLAGPLLGGVVRADDLRLRHHSVLVLRESVAVWKEAFQTIRSSGSPWTKAKKRMNWMKNYLKKKSLALWEICLLLRSCWEETFRESEPVHILNKPTIISMIWEITMVMPKAPYWLAAVCVTNPPPLLDCCNPVRLPGKAVTMSQNKRKMYSKDVTSISLFFYSCCRNSSSTRLSPPDPITLLWNVVFAKSCWTFLERDVFEACGKV